MLQTKDDEILALCNTDDIEHEIEESEDVSTKISTTNGVSKHSLRN